MKLEAFYIILIALLVISMIALIVLTQEDRKNLVNVDQCFKPKGEYAVEAGFESDHSVKLCGANGDSVCTFTVSNIENAFNICNSNPNKCTRFTYNEKSKSMTFVDDTPSFKRNSSVSIFIRQTGAS